MYINMCVYIPICTCKYTVCIYIYIQYYKQYFIQASIYHAPKSIKKKQGGVFSHIVV